MVGRGWWLLVLTVCVAWMVCCVCGGSFCQQGQEFYDSRDGQCVPCTRCQDPLVVVVPCYVFRDAVCAPAIDFLPNLSRHVGPPRAPVTLSTPSTSSFTGNISRDMHLPHQHERRTSNFEDETQLFLSEPRKTLGHRHEKDRSLVTSESHRNISNNGSLSLGDTTHFEKHNHKKHHHRHKHHGSDFFGGPRKSRGSKSLLVAATSDLETNGSDNVSQADSANESSVFILSDSSSSNSGLFGVNISDGANSDKDAASSDLQEEEELETSHGQNAFFLMSVVVISVCVIVLICIILSQLRKIFVRRNLKRVCNDTPAESSNEVAVMAQLLPSELSVQRSTSTFSVFRNPSSDTRCISRMPVSDMSIRSSPTSALRGQIMLESEHSTGQMYPPIPFTMDRLLEQRRVLGPSTSVDTNLYIESWQQADSQPPSQRTPSTISVLAMQTFPPSESVSACPSPVPLRTYRLSPASTSASPVIGVRGLGSRVAVWDPLTPMPTWNPPRSESMEVVLNSRT